MVDRALVGLVAAIGLFIVARVKGWSALEMGAGIVMLLLVAALVYRGFVRSVSPTMPVVRPTRRGPAFSSPSSSRPSSAICPRSSSRLRSSPTSWAGGSGKS